MKLVAVDQQTYHDAKEIAALLAAAGLHPTYDDLPRYALKGHMTATTTIYVPAEEAEHARAVLAKHYEDAEQRMRMHLAGWWWPLLPPLLAAVGIGVFVGMQTAQPMAGLAAWLISFLMLIQAMSFFRRGGEEERNRLDR